MSIVNQQIILPMKKNDTINFVFLFLCLLLLGFVYLNNKMPESPRHFNQKAWHQSAPPAGNSVR